MAEEKKQIFIIGCGPGGREYMTVDALKAVNECEIIYGHEKSFLLFDNLKGKCVNISKCFLEYVDEIISVANNKRVGVLVSGNPLVFSFGNVLLAKAGKSNCKIIPGVGCLSVACSRLGVSPVNVFSVSVHGRKPDVDVQSLMRYEKIALYTGNDEVAKKYFQSVCETLLPEYICYVCKNLTMDNEKIIEITGWDDKYAHIEGLSLVLFVKRICR